MSICNFFVSGIIINRDKEITNQSRLKIHPFDLKFNLYD